MQSEQIKFAAISDEIISRSDLAVLPEGSCRCPYLTRIGIRWRAIRYIDSAEIGWYVITAIGHEARPRETRPYIAIAVERHGVPHTGELQ